MSNGVFIWIVIFAVSAVGFFLIAAIVAVRGFFDLQLLLTHSNRNDKFEPESDITE
ncbi:MAG: hypothetical protein M3209_11475 [Acidobacteriota bacterium]|nr:hypothetical protein [Acidobacteriota bacterium]